MEQLRLELELDKQSNGGGRLGHLSSRFSRVDSSQRDSGLPDIDHPSPSSLPPNSLKFSPQTNNNNNNTALSSNFYSSSSPSASSSTANTVGSSSSTPIRRVQPSTNEIHESVEMSHHSKENGSTHPITLVHESVLGVKGVQPVIHQHRTSYNSTDSGMLDFSM